jgi:hypothetical protein
MAFVKIAIASAVLSAGTAAYGAKQQRKAQKKAREEARYARFVDGSLTQLPAPAEIVPEEVIGTDVAGIEETLKAMDYQGGEPPIPGLEDLTQTDAVDEQTLAALLEEQGLAELLPQMADGGPVGTPNDVYYFGVPQIMGMMQDPDPQIQQVGMQLAGQLETMPDAGMVPATMDQIRTMAYGGAVKPEKFEIGGTTEYNPELDADFIAQQEALEELLELDELVEKGVISEARAEYDRQRLSGRAFPQESQPGTVLTDRDKENFRKISKKGMAYGGALSEERLNNARLR